MRNVVLLAKFRNRIEKEICYKFSIQSAKSSQSLAAMCSLQDSEKNELACLLRSKLASITK